LDYAGHLSGSRTETHPLTSFYHSSEPIPPVWSATTHCPRRLAAALSGASGSTPTRVRQVYCYPNKGFEDWGEIFGDDVMAAALIDRLLHHCHIVSIRGNSDRMRHHTDLFPVLTPTLEGEQSQSSRSRKRRETPTT
jgi:hypothetical protein